MTSFQKLIHLFAGPPVSSGTHLSDGSLRVVGKKYCHQSEANWHGLQSCTGQNLCRPTVGGTSIMGIWRTTTQPQYQAMYCNAPRTFDVTKASDAEVNQSYWVFQTVEGAAWTTGVTNATLDISEGAALVLGSGSCRALSTLAR